MHPQPIHGLALPSATLTLVLSLGALTPSLSAKEPTEEQLQRIAAALPTEAPASPESDRRVLIFSRTNGFRHSSIETGAATLIQLGQATGAYVAEHTEDESVFERDRLFSYDAVIMLNTTGEIFRPRNWSKNPDQLAEEKAREARLKENLVAFVQSGRGLAGMHSATDTYKNWDAYNAMMGGAFAGHPWHMLVRLKNHQPDHPISRMIAGRGFEVTDEIYQFRNDTAKASERRMLLSLTGELADLGKGAREDGYYPISWIDTYGDGRIFYCSLGHREEIFWNTTVLQHYLAGIQFALGDLEADATPISVN